ncbi:MAG: hypothetical protein U5L96_12010 [Owenweeksia sp.]|nr:hypothetical protein [Owenweeksia sp.]
MDGLREWRGFLLDILGLGQNLGGQQKLAEKKEFGIPNHVWKQIQSELKLDLEKSKNEKMKKHDAPTMRKANAVFRLRFDHDTVND